MQILHQQVRVGERVRVRKQRWFVAAAQTYERCQVVTLSGIGPRNAGTRQSIVLPFDTVERLDRRDRIRIVGRRRWRRQCRALLAGERPAGCLATASRARIDLLPYQLEPALALLRGVGSRVLIADEVGLGKTIQAGLIVSELGAAGAERALIVTPAGLREQWAAELRDRFGLDAAIFDMREARTRASLLPAGLNPWLTVPLVITSIDYLKRPEVLPAVEACRWDVVVVDEAHGVTPASDRHDALSRLCKRSSYVVLLTATPHNGDRSAFVSLCRLGEIEREAHGRLLVFRRTRADAGLAANRRVHCVRVKPTADERRMHDRLFQLARAIRAEKRDGTDRLALAMLHKRALSSAHSLHTSVGRRLLALDGKAAAGEGQPRLPLEDGDGEFDLDDDAPAWTAPALADGDRERTLLEAVADAAARAAAHESKLDALSRLVTRLARLGEPAIVFTEYRDTLLHLERMLAARVSELAGVAVGVLHGGLGRDERRLALDDFRSRRRPILLATDAGGQGLNLHQACRIVINLELPWNPMRLEQRIGRVDRIGQTHKVHAFHLILNDSGEVRIFDRLKSRIEQARQDIDVSNPLSTRNDEAMALSLVMNEDDVSDEASARLPSTAAGAPPPARSSADASLRICSSSARHGRRRLPVGDEAPPSARSHDDAEPGGSAWPQTRVAHSLRLTAAAETERERLTRARGIRPKTALDSALLDDPLLEGGTLVMRARKSRTRARLSGQVLVVFQSIVEDRCGRIVCSQSTPILISAEGLDSSAPGEPVPAAILRLLAGCWHPPEPMLDHRLAFTATRIAREHAVAQEIASAALRLVQPGLFDRGAERGADSRRVAAREATERAAGLGTWLSLEPTRHRPALILLP
jgi:superfamily II DNA or RNA helicase